MFARKTVIPGIIIVAALLGATPVFAAANNISKSTCEGCGCKYERDCDAGGCSISCSCQNGPQNDCYVKKAGSSGAIKLPSAMTKYRIHQAAPAAKQ